jgi:peptidoglycan/LPS O-acetylase OafA/YrhL
LTLEAIRTEPVIRIPELDGLRGIAVCAVLVWHFVGAMLDPSLGAWTKILYHTTILGRTGVDLFFVLSGFLITGIILDRKQGAIQFLKSFYIRRVLRIVPSYALLVFVFWMVVLAGVSNSIFSSETPWWHHLSFTQNLWMAKHDTWGPSAISVTWSVAIEEQFYMVFPVLALLVPRRILLGLLIGIALFSIFYRAVAFVKFDSAFTMYVHTLSRLDGLAMGGVVACLWRSPAFAPWLADHSLALRWWFIGMCFGVPLLFIGMIDNLPKNMAIWGHTYLTLLYGTCLISILRSVGNPSVAWLRNSNLCKLGLISYTVYLFHPLLISVVFLLAERPERLSTFGDVLLAAAALLLSLLWSSISLRWLEKPLTHFGRKWRY